MNATVHPIADPSELALPLDDATRAKMKHTPGPWQSNDYTADGRLVLACAVWTRDSNTPIATTRFQIGKYAEKDRVIQHANARLIAAAPDLLAALQDCITDEGATARKSHARAMQRLAYISEIARAAIRKVQP